MFQYLCAIQQYKINYKNYLVNNCYLFFWFIIISKNKSDQGNYFRIVGSIEQTDFPLNIVTSAPKESIGDAWLLTCWSRATIYAEYPQKTKCVKKYCYCVLGYSALILVHSWPTCYLGAVMYNDVILNPHE